MIKIKNTFLRALTLAITISFVAVFGGLNANAAAPLKRGKSVLLMDAKSGKILYQEEASSKRYPASLTKMMTLYMLFYAVDNTKLSMGSKLPVSANAASKPATNLSLKKGQFIKVEDAIKALIVQSANDVATVVAESLGKSESNFGRIMTQKARQLGMNNTNFNNASGLPDSGQISTAYDIAILSRALMRDFPKYYHYFQNKTFSYNGRTYKNHNDMLGSVAGIEGLKTGYIRASGFHLATSYRNPRTGRKVIAIYMGANTPKERKEQLISLINHYKSGRLYAYNAKRNNRRFALNE